MKFDYVDDSGKEVELEYTDDDLEASAMVYASLYMTDNGIEEFFKHINGVNSETIVNLCACITDSYKEGCNIFFLDLLKNNEAVIERTKEQMIKDYNSERDSYRYGDRI